MKSQFNIGQHVQHRMLGYPGVVIDVDAEYTLTQPTLDELDVHESFLTKPWYHVILQDENGKHIHTYLAESQISERSSSEDEPDEGLNDISRSIYKQYNDLKARI